MVSCILLIAGGLPAQRKKGCGRGRLGNVGLSSLKARTGVRCRKTRITSLVNFSHFGTQTMRHTSRTQEPPLSSASTLDDQRWAAFVTRDASCDGQFYVAVETTGIYCRPSCPARRPKRANVRFHETAAEAEAAGFHPCKRCKPHQPNLVEQRAAKVAEACRLIETAEVEPSLDTLAQAV